MAKSPIAIGAAHATASATEDIPRAMTVNANNGWATARPTLSTTTDGTIVPNPLVAAKATVNAAASGRKGASARITGAMSAPWRPLVNNRPRGSAKTTMTPASTTPIASTGPTPARIEWRMSAVLPSTRNRRMSYDTDLGSPMSDRSQQTEQRDRNEEEAALGRPETPGDDQHEDEAADAAADDPDEVEGSAAGDDSQISTGGDANYSPARGGASGTR